MLYNLEIMTVLLLLTNFFFSYSFSYVSALARTSIIVLKWSSESRHPCPTPDCKGSALASNDASLRIVHLIHISNTHINLFLIQCLHVPYNNFTFTECFHTYYLIYFWQLLTHKACTRVTVCSALKLRQKLREFQLQ